MDDEKLNSANGSPNSNISATQGQGINLALDPNLINLTLSPSLITPGAIPNSVNDTGSQPDQSPSAIGTPGQNIHNTGTSLIKNPHEIYGQLPLSQLIPLILQERGPSFKFADLSEERLMEELSNNGLSNEDKHTSPPSELEKPIDDDLMEIDFEDKNNISKDESAPESNIPESNAIYQSSEPQLTQEQFLKVRKDIVDHINMAMNESSLSLEFVSLLLSSVRENNANSSMSAFLKKNASPGSLNSDKIPYTPLSKEETNQLEVLNKGWKLKSLNDSRIMLKENYLKLSASLQREHIYWKKVSNHINNSDVIFKLRDKTTGQRSLGIKYGYEDSGSTYKLDRGIAILRNNPLTDLLELVPFQNSDSDVALRNYEKFIRVRIFTKIESEDDYILSGESLIDNEDGFEGILGSDHSQNDPKFFEDIRFQIKILKKFILEKELMYQLKKESSRLISYGVTIENENKVIIELPNEKFEIELLSLTDSSLIDHERDAPKVNDKRANLMHVTLRMLLVVIFKKNLKNKLMSPKVKKNLNIDKDILLIRPILGRMRHSNYKMLLKKLLENHVLNIIEGTQLVEKKLDLTENSSTEENIKFMDKHVAKLIQDISAFDCILNPCKTQFDIYIPNKGCLSLTLESPNYCNAVINIKYLSENGTVKFDTEFSEFKEIEEFIHFIITEYVK
ncbi:hypothetical protein NCAS_0A14980 [Naumovozyma castellii]|uniref:Mediator of RNA polymerase II transcription subunit 17 n=1 Tax=Naumovozyma castellii TaxID=27288 RepID=G0V9A5_NAUCA|nr:hypothetical protein NCAS_0A14980 [Naumovozyma castellii CBS 4309]CCC68056.1 hypothetical protein NCAS_0A14980 [Naumovozyma castellii CBS 4309]